MVTKEQAMSLRYGSELHYTGKADCSKVVGPRGGVKVNVVHVRVSGQCQTWKRDVSRFRLPIKYGMYESFEITERNAADFHLPAECPIGAW